MNLLPGIAPSYKEYISAMERGAEISDCGRYRTRLWRRWDSRKGRVLVIMLNPSTADASQDDPTIRRCIRFAILWGYGGLEVKNLFSLRATDPGQLYLVEDPIGPGNHQLVAEKEAFDLIIAAWGNHGRHLGRGAAVISDLSSRGLPLCHLGLTKLGEPRHPLYVSSNTVLQPLE